MNQNINNWKWCFADRVASATVERAAEAALSGHGQVVKSNALRSVFRVSLPDGVFFVKHDRPGNLSGKIKSRVRSKVKAEFDSAMTLVEAGVPVAEYLGWARMKGQGLLVSKQTPGAVSARHFWYDNAYDDEQKKLFLTGLERFLSTFVAAGFRHPDFHLGNLLYVPEENAFHMVDPYGVAKDDDEDRRFQILRIIGAMRGELKDAEGERLIKSCGGSPDDWGRILAAESAEMWKVWPKRKAAIAADDPRYCERDGEIRRRKDINGRLVTPSDDAIDIVVRVTRRKAEEIWLRSFLLQIHRIPHRRAALWREAEGRQEIVLESIPAEPAAKDEITELLERCETAGFTAPAPKMIKRGRSGRLFIDFPWTRKSTRRN